MDPNSVENQSFYQSIVIGVICIVIFDLAITLLAQCYFSEKNIGIKYHAIVFASLITNILLILIIPLDIYASQHISDQSIVRNIINTLY